MGLDRAESGSALPLDVVVNHPPAKAALYCELSRPVTLLLPMVGILSGGCTAAVATRQAWQPGMGVHLAMAAMAAMVLNAASNALNQVTDLEIDKVNKPSRPLVRGALQVGEALIIAGLGYGLAIGLAMAISWTTASLFLAAAVATLVYSLPQLGRLKRFTCGSSFTIAIPRGCLLKVAGWSVVAPLSDPQPWVLGTVFTLFLLGATTTKDFADVEGDRANGCLTLPVRYGAKRAAWIIAPFFVLPWWLLPLGTQISAPGGHGAHLLSAGLPAMLVLAAVLAVWGASVVDSVLRDPEDIGAVENHPAWKSMYSMALMAHLGLVAAYAV